MAGAPGIAPEHDSGEPRRAPLPSRQSLRGLDWFIFFLADVQTGFGPFIAVYLTTQKWTQVEIGFVLSIGGVIALIGQIPGGAIVDAVRSTKLVAAAAIAVIGGCALGYAAFPVFPIVVTAATLHAMASCVLGPAIAAISLGLVGPLKISERLGRNARFASLGNGVAAAVMGTCGYYLSSRSVFVVTFLLALPTLYALSRIRAHEIDAAQAHGAVVDPTTTDLKAIRFRDLIRQRPLLIFAGAVLLLQLANAAMLPLMAGVVTTRSADWAPVLIAFCIVVPQVIVAATSPTVGRRAQQFGRRPLLMLGFAALTIRGLLFATVTDPYALVAVQAFDGVTAAVFSVMIPLIVADVAFGSGRFSLAQGIVGTATGIGAALSTVLAGFVADRFGAPVAFVGLAGVAALGLLMIWTIMPETRRNGEAPA
ncbi:MAG: transporter [Tardiphaga sp.]|nr:transporter [Tardiphaga sp.]